MKEGGDRFAPTPKKERAEFVYSLKQQYPAVSVSVLCHAFDISESVFRTERLIHIDEWEKHKSLDFDIFELVLLTKAGEIEDIKECYPGFDYKPIISLTASLSS
jgi:hypothetical protein